MISKDNLRDVLANLGYTIQDNKVTESWTRNFNDSVAITVDFTTERIHYPLELKAHRDTTKHFSAPENFVVLEWHHALTLIGLYTDPDRAREAYARRTWGYGRIL